MWAGFGPRRRAWTGPLTVFACGTPIPGGGALLDHARRQIHRRRTIVRLVSRPRHQLRLFGIEAPQRPVDFAFACPRVRAFSGFCFVARRFGGLYVFAGTLDDVDEQWHFSFLDFALPVCLIVCRRGFSLPGPALVDRAAEPVLPQHIGLFGRTPCLPAAQSLAVPVRRHLGGIARPL